MITTRARQRLTVPLIFCITVALTGCSWNLTEIAASTAQAEQAKEEARIAEQEAAQLEEHAELLRSREKSAARLLCQDVTASMTALSAAWNTDLNAGLQQASRDFINIVFNLEGSYGENGLEESVRKYADVLTAFADEYQASNGAMSNQRLLDFHLSGKAVSEVCGEPYPFVE